MDLYSMIEAGGRVKFEVTGEDLVRFADRLIAKAMEARDAQIAAMPKDETYLSTDETARLCRVSKTTLWTWEKAGYLVPAHVGKRKCYAKSQVMRLLSGNGGTLRNPNCTRM